MDRPGLPQAVEVYASSLETDSQCKEIRSRSVVVDFCL